MAEYGVDIAVRVKRDQVDQLGRLLGQVEKQVGKLNRVKVSLDASPANRALDALNNRIREAEQIAARFSGSNKIRSGIGAFSSSIGGLSKELASVRASFDQAKTAADRQARALELLSGQFKKTRLEGQAFANASADFFDDGLGSLAERIKEIEKLPRNLFSSGEAIRELTYLQSLAVQGTEEWLTVSKALGRQLELNANIRLGAQRAQGPMPQDPFGTRQLLLPAAGQTSGTFSIVERQLEAGAALEQSADRRARIEAKIEQLKELEAEQAERLNKSELASIRNQTRGYQQRLSAQREADKEAQSRRAQRMENLALGAGFPLLFGGGPGAVLGGVAGGLMPGKGFGAQILLSALGQVFDQAAQEARDFAIALRTTGDGTQYLEQRLGTLDPKVKAFVTNLSESGQTAEAAEMSVSVLSDAIGDEYANAIVKAGKTTETFSNNAAKFFTGLQARVAVLINAINDFGAAYDRLLGISSTSVSDLVLAEPPQETLGQQQVRRRVEDLQAEGKVQQLQLDLATAIAGKNEQSEFIIQRKLLLQRAINEAAAIERDLEDKKITAQEKSIALSNIDKKLQTDLLKLLTDQTKKQQDRAKEAERLAREEQQNTNRRLGYQSQILQGLAQEYGIQTQGVDVVYGAISGYETKLRLAAKTAVVQKEALRLERDAALNTEEGARNQDLINTLYDNRIEKLRQETSFNENNLRLLKDRAILEERLATLEQTKGFGRQLREIDRLSTQGMSQEDIFMRGLKARRESYVEPLLDRAQQLSEQIMSGTLSRDALKATNDELNRTELQLANVIDRLDVLDKQDIVWENNRFQVELLSNTLNSVGQQVSSVFEALIVGTDNWNQTLAGVFNSLARIAFNFGLSSLAGDDGKGFFSFLTGSLKPRALGGPVSAGSSYLVGERGPEMFVPRTSGSIYPNDAMGIGGGNITVNVDATGTSVQGNGDDSKRLGEAIGVAIRQELIKQKRPGGLLA